MENSGETSRLGVDRIVLSIAVAISLAFVVWGVIAPESLGTVTGSILTFVTSSFGWVFLLATFGFLVFVLYLAFSRFGSLRLGRQDERPEFRTVSWIAMMFSAGMGIGLMFYGVAEPITYLGDPPHGQAEAGTREAGLLAMQYSYFHWAFHPWAIYAVLGLALAFFTFRKGMPNLISSAFYPLLGDRVNGPVGKGIDILAIFATLFGSATSLGLGALQVNGGLSYLTSIPSSNTVAILIIAALTLAFIVSAISGVHRGIQWLSNTNMVLAIVLLLFLFVVGPTVFILNTLTEGVGSYVTNLLPMSFTTAAFGDGDFLSAWTIFYWAWWVSWAPFVGTFIARISRGRTIREFVIGVILAPSIVGFVWFAILGGAALDLELSGAANIVGAVAESQEVALFTTLDAFPLAAVMSVIAIVLVALFFVSGADAASVVMGMLSSKGAINPNRVLVAMWGVLTGAVAAICLWSGGLEGLQTAAILSAAPFVLVMIALCFSLFKALNEEVEEPDEPDDRGPREAPESRRAMSRPSGARETVAPQRMSDDRDRQENRTDNRT